MILFCLKIIKENFKREKDNENKILYLFFLE